MKIVWEIEPSEVKRLQEFIESRNGCHFVKIREERNLATLRPEILREEIWLWLVVCLMTTQQKSGPGSPLNRFANERPFPLRLEVCLSFEDGGTEATNILQSYGGILKYKKIGQFLSRNLSWLESSGWDLILACCERLRDNDDPAVEREVARTIQDSLAGFGPKQSRNLLQNLGLTKYEVPIDSRLSAFLHEFGFPIQLTGPTLSNRHVYELISDGFQALAKSAGVFPCVLDAAIFASKDDVEWTEANTVMS